MKSLIFWDVTPSFRAEEEAKKENSVEARAFMLVSCLA
jgi:hypothetical protein